MAGRERYGARDRRRRSYGQNFLVDQRLIDRFIAGLDLEEDELVVDIGAGVGALTIPLARAGARVWAVERDPVWVDRLTDATTAAGVADRVRVIRADLRRLRLPKEPYRVAASPPFGHTTALLELLLDHLDAGPTQADLIVQREVANKHATTPPVALKTASWTPWWEFTIGLQIHRSAFRPQPSVDAAVLTVTRRSPAILPTRLARVSPMSSARPGRGLLEVNVGESARSSLNCRPPGP